MSGLGSLRGVTFSSFATFDPHSLGYKQVNDDGLANPANRIVMVFDCAFRQGSFPVIYENGIVYRAYRHSAVAFTSQNNHGLSKGETISPDSSLYSKQICQLVELEATWRIKQITE